MISRAAAKAATGGWKSGCEASAGGHRTDGGSWQQIKAVETGPTSTMKEEPFFKRIPGLPLFDTPSGGTFQNRFFSKERLKSQPPRPHKPCRTLPVPCPHVHCAP